MAVMVFSPVSLTFGPLSKNTNEVSAFQAVTVTAPTGFVSVGNTVLDVVGDTEAKFQLSPAADGTGASDYGASLTVTDPIDDTTGVVIYVRAKATSDETANTDTSCSITVTGNVIAE